MNMKTTRARVVCLFTLATLAVSAFEAQAAGETPTPRRLVAVKAQVAPKIDGRLDDPCWKAAAKAAGFSIYSNADRLHPEQTIGRVCYDDNNLYIAMECTVKEMDKFRARMKEAAGQFKYYHGGVIEVFLDANHDRKTFQQYLLHANGSSRITLPKGDIFKILNEDYLTSKAAITKTGFTIEMSFPLAMLHLHPDTAKVWGLNLNRSHDLYGEKHDSNGFFSSWNSTRGRGFPNAELFGELVMDDDFSRFYWKVDFAGQPQVGHTAVALRIENETGRDFAGTLTLELVPAAGKGGETRKYQKSVSLKAGASGVISFEHPVSAGDTEAKYNITLVDAAGKVRYLGGTQTEDLTPGDSWPPPAATDQQQKAGYIVFHRPYTHAALYKAVPKAQEVVSALSLSACRGEFEPATFSVYPLRDLKTLTAAAGDLTGPGGASIPASAIDLRKVTWQSAWKNPRSFEAKEHLLRKFESLNLTKGRTQRLWLTLKVPPKAPAGDYRGTVTLTCGGAVTSLPLSVRVLPFELSAPDGMGYFMYYPGRTHKSFLNPEFFKKTVQDQRDHGMTTFTIYNWNRIKDAKTGKFKIDVDNHVPNNYGVTYAQMMDILREEGFGDVPLVDVYAGHYGTELIIELYNIYRARGWPDFMVYVEDEIDYPERIARARRILTALKKAAPHIKTTTAMGPKGAAALGHMYDVWIGCSTAERVKHCLSMGKHPWTYSCRPIYEVCTAYERYFYGRYPWKIGLKGVGLWSYAQGRRSFSDRFGRRYPYSEDFVFTSELKHIYGHVYFEKDQVIPVVTWEGVREGIDDYRYMLTLKKAAQAAVAGSATGAQAAGRAGLKLLQDIADRTDLTARKNDYGGSKYLTDPKYMGDMDAERTRVIEAILNIRSKTKKGQ